MSQAPEQIRSKKKSHPEHHHHQHHHHGDHHKKKEERFFDRAILNARSSEGQIQAGKKNNRIT
jgi:hypothetical protein